MKFKYYFLIGIMLMVFLSFSIVSANNNTNIYQNELYEGNFEDLNYEIQNTPEGGVLYLHNNYSLNSNSKGEENIFKEGININKSITIDGGNNVIDGKNLVRIFNVNSDVTIRNIVLINGYHKGSIDGAAAILISSGNLELENSILANNSAVSTTMTRGTAVGDGGGALCARSNTLVIINNCSFINNKIQASENVGGGACIFKSGSYFSVKNSLFLNNRVISTEGIPFGGAICERNTNGEIRNSSFINNSAGIGKSISVHSVPLIGNLFINSGIDYTFSSRGSATYNSFINGGVSYSNSASCSAVVQNNWYGYNPFSKNNDIVADLINNGGTIHVTLASDGYGNNLSNPEYLFPRDIKFEGNVKYTNLTTVNAVAINEFNGTLKEGYIYSVNATVDNQLLELYFRYVHSQTANFTADPINESYLNVGDGEFKIKGKNKVYHNFYEVMNDALLMDGDVTIYMGKGIYTYKWSDSYYNYDYFNYDFNMTSDNKNITIIGAGNDKSIFKGESRAFKINGNSSIKFINITFTDFTDNIFIFNTTSSNNYFYNCKFRNISTDYVIYLTGENSTLFFIGCYFDNVGNYTFWNNADNSYIVVDSSIFTGTNYAYARSEVYKEYDYRNHITTIYHNFNDYYIFNHNFLLSDVSDGFDCTPNVYLSNDTIYLGDSVDIIADFNYFTNSSGMHKFNSGITDDFTITVTTASGSNIVNLDNAVATLKYTPDLSGKQTILVKYGNKITQLTLNIISRQTPSFNVEGMESIIANLPEDATGNVLFNVNGNQIVKEVVNGIASVNIAPLEDIKYTVEVSYPGDLKYTPINKTLIFSPQRNLTYLNISCSDSAVGSNAIINVYTNANGNMRLIIDNITYNSIINNNFAVFNIENLSLGNHSIIAIYDGNAQYLPESSTGYINIMKNIANLSSYVETVLSGEDVIMNITLNKDISSEVYIFMNSKIYKTNVENGVGYLNLTRIHGGNYSYRLYYNGNGKYYAADINETFYVEKLNVVYVDSVNGDDVNNVGSSQNDAFKSFKLALECVRYGGTIYMLNGIYGGVSNTKLTITQPITVIGVGNAIFDGENKNNFFTIGESLSINFKNIAFKNISGNAFEIGRLSYINIENCTFDGGYGRVFSNNGILNVNNSSFKNINSNSIISNQATLYLSNSTFESITSDTVKGSAVSNYGNAIILNSTFRNSNIYGGARCWGLIYNEGTMSVKSCIFDSNSAVFYQAPIGTGNIYNKGALNATYNVFMRNTQFFINWDIEEDHRFLCFYNDLGGIAYIDYNWWDCIDSPYDLNLTNVKADTWFIYHASVEDYIPLDIGEDIDINITLTLNTDDEFNPNDLPLYDVTFDNIIKQFNKGVTTFNFNKTSVKGTYGVLLKIGGIELSYLIEVGKNYSSMDVITGDVFYGESIQINISVFNGNVKLNGTVSVYFNNETYSLTLVNGYSTITFDDVVPGTHDLKIVYEGNDDYFKKFYYGNITVNKQKTFLKIDLDDIMVGQKGVVHISIEPATLVNAQGYIYIDGVRRNVYFYNGKATYDLNKFDIGQYNITVEFLGSDYYDSSYASTIFSVNKYNVSLTLSIDDIYVGERAYLYISKDPGDLSGDVHFIVEGTTQREGFAYFSPEQTETRIILRDLGGGTYNITVFYDGDEKYSSCEESVSFSVLKYVPDFNVTVTNNDTNAHFDFYLNSTKYNEAIGGVIQFWFNDNVTYINVTNGSASYDIGLIQGYNHFFAYYMGDSNYNYSSWNKTIVINVPFVLKGDNVTMNVGVNDGYRVYLTDAYGKPLVNQSIIFNFSDELYQGFTDVNGSIFFTMYFLDAGIYNITASYNETSINNTITILKISDYPMNVTYSENMDGNELTITITLPEDSTGNITVNDKFINVSNGQAKVTFSNLKKGNTTFNILYDGDRRYESRLTNVTINVGDDKKTLITAPDIEMYYHDGTRFEVTLTDRKYNPIAMQTVTINLNNVNYNINTDNDGKVSLGLNLESGTYKVIVSYEDGDYTSSYVNSTILIKPTITGGDVNKVYRNSSGYTAQFRDFTGNLLTSGEATFNINGVLYRRNINSQGLVSLAINLNPGSYVITAINPVTGEKISNSINVSSCVVDNKDLVKYYKNSSQYSVRALDSHGNPVGAGEYVLFNINGVIYVRQTNANGYATLSINLAPGEYTITAEYNFCKVSNKINVRSVLSAYNLVKKYGASNPFRAFLLDNHGKPLEGAAVTFNINGVLYERITDEDGMARLNINLQKGRYIITSSYNGESISNTITIA